MLRFEHFWSFLAIKMANLLSRSVILFILGIILSLGTHHPNLILVMDSLYSQHSVGKSLSSSPILLPIACGIASVLIGVTYPLADTFLKHKVKRDWSAVIRCCGGFIGVNYAASKLPWATSGPRVSLTLGLLAAGLWFLLYVFCL